MLETGGARGIACPAQHCPSFPSVSPPTAGGGWEGCGCGRRARGATGRRCTPRPRAFRSWSGPIDAADTARGRLGPAECLCRSELAPSPAELFLQLFFAGGWKLWLLGGRFFGRQLVSCVLERLMSREKMVLDCCRSPSHPSSIPRHLKSFLLCICNHMGALNSLRSR